MSVRAAASQRSRPDSRHVAATHLKTEPGEFGFYPKHAVWSRENALVAVVPSGAMQVKVVERAGWPRPADST